MNYRVLCNLALHTYCMLLFNIQFLLSSLLPDLIAIPNFGAGAMENWGLVTYRETELMYIEGLSTSLVQQRVTRVIAHELAHQWFGNLVTMQWYD